MIINQIKATNQKLDYYKVLLFILIIVVVLWFLLSIQSAQTQKFDDKKAQTASKAIDAKFNLDILNSLSDRYNPTELELKKVNPYTGNSSIIKPIEIKRSTPSPEASSSAD